MTGKQLNKLVTRLMAEWCVPFGFGHYQLLLEAATDDDKFAHVRYSVEEEWLCITICPSLLDLTAEQVEHVVLHELAHVLQAVGASGETGEEVVCNRIASMLVGGEFGVRSLAYMREALKKAEHYFDDDERDILTDAMPGLIVRLPAKHREVLCAIFYDGRTLEDIGQELGLNRSTILRRREAAIKALRAAFLEEGSNG